MPHFSVKKLLFAICAMLLCNLFAYAQTQNNYIYIQDNQVPNTVSAFSVSPTGTLTTVTGSPFSTGGNGTGFAAFDETPVKGIITVGNFLYVGNSESNSFGGTGIGSVSAFSINPSTGALTALTNSPFSTGISTNFDITMAVSPDGKFLFIGGTDSRKITVFSIASNGILSEVTGSPFDFSSTAAQLDGFVISPNGKFLAFSDGWMGTVHMLNIASSGSLSEVTGSPFEVSFSSDGNVGLDFTQDSKFLYLGLSDTNQVDAYSVSPTGTLTELSGAPFTFTNGNSLANVLVSADNKFLYIFDEDNEQIIVATINSSGSLTEITGSPFFGGSVDPNNGIINQKGNLLFIFNEDGSPNLDVYQINQTTGALTFLNTTSVPNSTVLYGATYPPAPRGIQATLDHNTIYVADTLNNRIQRSTNDGLSWQTVGFGAGVGLGQFNAPKGVTADSTDTLIFVADTNNNRVQRSTNGGTTWSVIASAGTSSSQVNRPQALAYDQTNNILYIADTGNNRILKVTNASSTPSFSIMATVGTAVGQFNQPRGIAVDSTGNVYVADTGNNRVQMFTTSWTTIASAGTALGSVNGATGIYVDGSNHIYIADTLNNRVQVTTNNVGIAPAVPSLTFSLFMGPGTAAGSVNAPQGIVYALSGNVFIGDTGNNRIQKKPAMGGTATVVGPAGLKVGQFNQPSGVR